MSGGSSMFAFTKGGAGRAPDEGCPPLPPEDQAATDGSPFFGFTFRERIFSPAR